jgi:hypothetical protein
LRKERAKQKEARAKQAQKTRKTMTAHLRGLSGKDRTTEGEDSWASSGNGCSTAAGTAGRPDDEDRRRWLRAYSRHEETPRHLILELNEAGDDYRREMARARRRSAAGPHRWHPTREHRR